MKCLLDSMTAEQRKSPPSRGAWIEIITSEQIQREIGVAPLAGGVD